MTTPWSEGEGARRSTKTAPELKLKCPRKVEVGDRAFVRIKASDDGVGLRRDPSGKRRVRTGRKGSQRVKAKAVDAVGNKTVETCRVKVVKRR